MVDQTKTLRMAVRAFEPFETALEKIWKEYCSTTGCEMELELMPLELEYLYDEILEQDGLEKGTWDLALMNTDWLAEAYQSGAIADLQPYIQTNPPEDYPRGWPESLLCLQQFGKGVYGLPFHDGPECLIYRKDLFEDPSERRKYMQTVGKELVPPETWEDFINIAHFFHRPENGLYGSVFAAYPDGHNTVFDFCLQLWTRGGELVDDGANITLNTPCAAEGLRFYRALLQDVKAVHPRCADFDSVKSGLVFARGEVAMMVNWFGFASLCEVHEESKTRGKVGITSIPRGRDGEKISLNVYWLYVLGAGSDHKDTAYDFIRYATTRENDKLLTLEGGIGCRLSTWRDVDVNKKVPYYHRLEELHKDARALPRRDDWAQIAHIIDELVLQAVNTDRPVTRILDEAQKSVDQLLAKPQL